MTVRRTTELLVPLAPALLLFVVLAAFVAVDPPTGFTSSSSPFTDEAWDIINARNFVLFGHWSTDDWNLYLLNFPFSVSEAAMFSVAGVGIVQARVISIVATALTVYALGAGLRPALGRGPALVAALAFGSAALVLYYGRLAYLEPLVALGVTVGTLGAIRATGPSSGRWGLLSGLALALAIGTKPSALFLSIGLLVGVAIVLGRSSAAARRWLVGAVVAIGLAGLTWLVVLGLEHRLAIGGDLRIWASEPLATTLGGWVGRVLGFPFRNDNMLILAAPLLIGAAGGAVLAIRRRDALSPTLRGLVGAAIGSLVLGFAVLVIVPYRPNRYEVPLLPAMAILTAVAWSLITEVLGHWSPNRWRAVRAAVVVGLVLPGVVMFSGWMRVTPGSLPGIQAEVASIIPPGAAVEGIYAPLFAMRAQAVTLVSRPWAGINTGDLYAVRDVRWYIGATGTRPGWAASHPNEWAAREERLCAPWGSTSVCVWQVP
ncbi:MAG TPA: glycosyltransferase family 39 protein [Candidatus Dormibacteraeota bacterium]|nr:glycosyltransferase family 39 protein [Candidatus Dormibacteraeota bacterium]